MYVIYMQCLIDPKKKSSLHKTLIGLIKLHLFKHFNLYIYIYKKKINVFMFFFFLASITIVFYIM